MSKNHIIASILSVALIILMIFSVTSVFAATYVVENDWKFELDPVSSDELYVASYLGSNDVIQIPALALGKTVTKISPNAFLNNGTVKKCFIPATVTEIGQNAFYGCTSLESLSFIGGVDTIGNNAFYGCSKLTEVVFYQQVRLEVLPRLCFSHCDSLTTVVLPDSVTDISDYAFSSCPSLRDVTIPASVVSISDKAFSNSDNVVIHGWSGSVAEQFANENGIEFVSMGESTITTEASSASTTAEIPTASETIGTAPSETTAPNDSVVTTATTSASTDPVESTTADPIASTDATDQTESDPTVVGKVYLIGDADLSGTINIKDATVIQKYSAGLINLDKIAKFVANCDGLGDINVKDATMIQKYCAGFLNVRFVGTEVII